MALLLKRHGIEQVRPLAGGFSAWRERGYPLVDLNQTTEGALHV